MTSPLVNLITIPFNRIKEDYIQRESIPTKMPLSHPMPNIQSSIFGEELVQVLNQIKIKNDILANKQKENEISISLYKIILQKKLFNDVLSLANIYNSYC